MVRYLLITYITNYICFDGLALKELFEFFNSIEFFFIAAGEYQACCTGGCKVMDPLVSPNVLSLPFKVIVAKILTDIMDQFHAVII